MHDWQGALKLLLAGANAVLVASALLQRGPGVVRELLAGIETLKATGYEHRASQRWASLYVDVMNLTIKRASLGGIIESIMSTLRMTTPFVLLLVGTMDVMNGELSLGQMLAANAFAAGFIGPVTSLVGTLSQLQVVRTYLARI